jgi:hypothetical protein
MAKLKRIQGTSVSLARLCSGIRTAAASQCDFFRRLDYLRAAFEGRPLGRN